MAIHAHSTTAPAVQPRLLRGGSAGPCAVLTTDEAIALTADVSDLPPLLLADTPEAVRGDIEALLTDHARAVHLRRELHQALDYGFALLDALDLPPMALDVIDDAICTLDALDASDEDREDGGDTEASLGWTAAGACSGYDFDDREHDTADAELSCGWTAKVDQVHLGQPQDDHETTALERFGKGFFRSGPDDAEDGHDAERVDEDGSEDEPYGWRFQQPNAVQIAARVAEVAPHG